MDASEHNLALQNAGSFSAADIEENKHGQYSASQIKLFESSRDFMRQSAEKYDNKKPLIRVIFGVGFVIFSCVLYFVGVFEILQNALGGLFLPVMCVAFVLALLLILVVIPRQYQDSVDTAKLMGRSLSQDSLGKIEVIEARAEVYQSQAGINRRGHQSGKITNILQMESIEFSIASSLREIIEPKRLYRVYAKQTDGVWFLLSMETLE